MYLEDKYTIAGLQFHVKFPVGLCKFMQHAGQGISIASDIQITKIKRLRWC